MSSNGAVGFFKRLLGIKKIGHAGTLDPGAAGVLVILVGKATKLSPYLMGKEKEYVFEITFGASTDTLDAYGNVTEKDDCTVTAEMIKAVLPRFTGEIDQVPPMYSAISINGKRAYQLARSGQTAELKSRRITIKSLDLIREVEQNRFLIKTVCSKGTYIRTLAADIGKALNTCAYTSFLERTRSGRFTAVDAVTMDEAAAETEAGRIEQFLLPMETALAELPAATVADADYKRITNGLDGTLTDIYMDCEEKECRIYCRDQLIGIGRACGGRTKIKTLLLTKE